MKIKHKTFKIIETILLITINIFIMVGCEAGKKSDFNKELTLSEKIEDFNCLYENIKENFAFIELNKRVNGVDWLKNKEHYLSRVELTQNDNEFYEELEGILKELNNGHSEMYKTSKEEICSISKNVEEAIRSGTKFNWTEKVSADILKNKVFLKRNNVTSKDLKKSINKDNDSNFSNKKNNEIIAKDRVQGKIGYIYIKSFNPEFIEKDKEIIYPYLNSVKNYKALIIDIRDNRGGSDLYWKEFLVPKIIRDRIVSTNYGFYKEGRVAEDYLKYTYGKNMKGVEKVDEALINKFPKLNKEIFSTFKYYIKNVDIINSKDSMNFQGKIYLLVDSNVYSASESFAVFCKGTKFATIVGEKTGGDGLGIVPAMNVLPNSGFLFSYPIVMGVDWEGQCNDEHKTEPDIHIKEVSRGEGFQMDNCIDEVLKREGIK